MKKEAVQRDCSDHQASWADVLSMGWHAERGTVTKSPAEQTHRATNMSSTARWLLKCASSRGVWPAISSADTLAPADNSAATASAWPLLAA
eukprot:363873-Chlamydomonas_euryale.AAC.8